MFTKDPIKRFWSKARIGGGCWEWTACKNQGGYGLYFFEGRLQVASRVAWQLTHGTIAKGIHICHICDNPACIRPSHLFLGTQRDNVRDMLVKDRGRKPSAQTKEIIQKLAAGERQIDLAEEYGISRQRIGQIKAKHL